MSAAENSFRRIAAEVPRPLRLVVQVTPKERHRKRLQNRKYGTARHKRAREEARAFVASGFARCSRCGERPAPGEPFDAGHDDRSSGPLHRPRTSRLQSRRARTAT